MTEEERVNRMEAQDEDPCVPTDLLELHVLLETSGVTPEEFKEVFGNEVDHER
jgi:hypothetical protein